MKNEVLSAEDKLIAMARRGNHEAFTELVQKHSGKIYGVSLRMLKNREDAEDNVQNVLVVTIFNLALSHHHQRSTHEIAPAQARTVCESVGCWPG
jgi:hypothetical protein